MVEDKAVTLERFALNHALKFARTFGAEPVGLDKSFMVRKADGSEERIGTYVIEMPEPFGIIYGANLPAWIAEQIDDNWHRTHPGRGGTFMGDYLSVHYRPAWNQFAMTDGLRFDGVDYAYVNYLRIFEEVESTLLFTTVDQEVLLSVIPQERERLKLHPRPQVEDLVENVSKY